MDQAPLQRVLRNGDRLVGPTSNVGATITRATAAPEPLNQSRTARMPRWLTFGTVAYYLFLFAAGPGPMLTGDSRGWSGYEGAGKVPLLTVAWDSITGRYGRPWPVVIPFAVLGDRGLIVAVQFALACAATIYLARAMFLVATGWRALTGGILVVALLIAPRFAGWHWYILSESITIAATAFMLGAAVRLCRTFTVGAGLVFLAGALVAATLRPQLALIVLAAAVVVCARWWRSRAVFVFALATVLVLVLAGAWWRANIATWHDGTPRPAVTAAYAFSDYSPIARELRAASRAEHPAPACFPVDRGFPADQAVIWQRLNESFNENRCERAVRWSDGFSSWYAGFLARHPVEVLDYAMWALPRALSAPEAPGPGWSMLPAPVAQLLTGSAEHASPGGTRGVAKTQPRMFTDVALLLLLGETVAVVVWRRRTRRDQQAILILGLLVGWSAIPVAIVGAFGNADPLFDLARVGVSASLILRVGVILAGIVLIDVWRTRTPRVGRDPSRGDGGPLNVSVGRRSR
jgi:hypothetical protein